MPSKQVDLIVTNARVLTMDEDNPRAEAVAVRNGRIEAVGDKATIGKLKGEGTEMIDADGGSVLPGFIEAHMHLFAGAACFLLMPAHAVEPSGSAPPSVLGEARS